MEIKQKSVLVLMDNKKFNTRRVSYDILRKITVNKAYSNIEMGNLYDNYSLDQKERKFVKSLVFGVLERQLLLDYIISLFVTKKADTETQLFLRIGLQQQLFMEVPPSAACNETVNVAKKVLDNNRAGFINAVLRNIGRNETKVREALETAPINIKYSVSECIYKQISEQYGEKTEAILKSFYEKKPLVLRINTLKITRDELIKKLTEQGVTAKAYSDTALLIEKGSGTTIDELKNGEYFVQGIGSQNAVQLLGASEGHTIIDVCACPGGKSFGAAIEMQNGGKIISLDLHENKLTLVNKGAKLLGIDIIKTKAFDSREVNEDFIGIADRVICDVPCSGLGVISAKPEIRYKSTDDFKELYKTQKRIISSAAKYLKSSGIMVYSTCTLNKHENEDIVAEFIAENGGFQLEYERTFLPFEEAGEGFYMAKIIKN
ncbi:MAG: 16S rRNA (cytosine(967)-C(5))-methyltransferase [Clostridiales bacterium GWF2_36_10]|nr:MAG: 16S rRNA (cytosine(967)-C(5))-methyltransferase [Clostridiales bacterium GWF2_36_10]HAN20806.1 16S rRNA (cytosine(967)-C(5))-methyltransferase RsmB [Clostridiales bacterium]